MSLTSIAPSTPSLALHDLAVAAATVVPQEGESLLALLDAPGEPTLARLLSLLAALAAARAALLGAGTAAAAALWDDLAGAARDLHRSLYDSLSGAPEGEQQRWLAYLRALSSGELPALATLAAAFTDPTLAVAVAGDFKRGKSTLLNALLGRRLLPTRVAPATAVPCRISRGPRLAVWVEYRQGGTREEIEPGELERYACVPVPGEEDLLAFRPEVAQIWIEVPDILPPGVTLVDLPGLNEEQGRAELARAELDRADAALMVLSATQLLAEDELQLVEALWDQGHRALLFAINYLDQLDAPGRILVEERAARLLGPCGGELGRTIFLVSARQAQAARLHGEPAPAETGLPALAAALGALLANQRAIWRCSRLRQALRLLEDAEGATGDAVLAAQEELRPSREGLAAAEAQLAAGDLAHSQACAEAEDELGALRGRLEEQEHLYQDRWATLEADLLARCRGERLTWVHQRAGNWLREEMIRAIREVVPEVTPRPEGYLRISVAPGLRLDRTALFAFYRGEASREWERFIGPARRARRQELEEALAQAENRRRHLDEVHLAARAPLEAACAAAREDLAVAEAAATEALGRARAASAALRAALRLPPP